jgi:hypothetical protein
MQKNTSSPDYYKWLSSIWFWSDVAVLQSL